MATIKEISHSIALNGIINEKATEMNKVFAIKIIEGLTVKLGAESDIWCGDYFTFVIIVENEEGYDFEEVKLNSVLDKTVMTLVPNTVTINGQTTADYTFDPNTGALTISERAPFTVQARGRVTLTFQVQATKVFGE